MPRTAPGPALDENQQAAIGHMPVSDKQMDYIRDLMRQRDFETCIPGRNSRPLRLPAELSREDASAVIDWLKRRPFRSETGRHLGTGFTPPRVLEEGGWLDPETGVMYHVSQTKDKRGWNVKVYNKVTEKLDFIGGSSYLPMTARKATKEEIAEAGKALVKAGHKWVPCYECGRKLTNGLSMELGIGPWCRGDRR